MYYVVKFAQRYENDAPFPNLFPFRQLFRLIYVKTALLNIFSPFDENRVQSYV